MVGHARCYRNVLEVMGSAKVHQTWLCMVLGIRVRVISWGKVGGLRGCPGEEEMEAQVQTIFEEVRYNTVMAAEEAVKRGREKRVFRVWRTECAPD